MMPCASSVSSRLLLWNRCPDCRPVRPAAPVIDVASTAATTQLTREALDLIPTVSREHEREGKTPNPGRHDDVGHDGGRW